MGQTYLINVLIVILVLAIIIFLLFRELFCWYWKINERIKILEWQNKAFEIQNKTLFAQMMLLAGIAKKSGVPIEEINHQTKQFGVEFKEDN